MHAVFLRLGLAWRPPLLYYTIIDTYILYICVHIPAHIYVHTQVGTYRSDGRKSSPCHRRIGETSGTGDEKSRGQYPSPKSIGRRRPNNRRTCRYRLEVSIPPRPRGIYVCIRKYAYIGMMCVWCLYIYIYMYVYIIVSTARIYNNNNNNIILAYILSPRRTITNSHQNNGHKPYALLYNDIGLWTCIRVPIRSSVIVYAAVCSYRTYSVSVFFPYYTYIIIMLSRCTRVIYQAGFHVISISIFRFDFSFRPLAVLVMIDKN